MYKLKKILLGVLSHNKKEKINLSMKVDVVQTKVEEIPIPRKPTGNNQEVIKLLNEIDTMNYLLNKPFLKIYSNSNLPYPKIPFEDIKKADSNGVANNLKSLKNTLDSLERSFKFYENDIEMYKSEELDLIQASVRLVESCFKEINKWLEIESNDPKYDYSY